MVIRVAPESGLYRHWPGGHHHFMPELFVVESGACNFECPGGSFRVGPGEVCIMPRGVPHREIPHDLGGIYRTWVTVHHEGGFCLIDGRRDKNGRPCVRDITIFHGSRSGSAFGLLSEAAKYAGLKPSYRHGYLCGLLVGFLSALLSDMEGGSREETQLSPLFVSACGLARQRISDTGLSVASLAADLKVTPDHLTRVFRKESGLGVSAWINSERVAVARGLLAEPGTNVSEAAWAAGFRSLSYFIRVFQKMEGISPGRYRSRLLALAAGYRYDDSEDVAARRLRDAGINPG